MEYNESIYERLIQLALRESIHYNAVRSVWKTHDDILIIGTIHVSRSGGVLLGRTKYNLNTRIWKYIEINESIQVKEEAVILPQVHSHPNAITIFTYDPRCIPDRARGTWKELNINGANGQSILSAVITCPDCGGRGTLEKHFIYIDGRIWPLIVCPYKGCDFHGWAQLEEWGYA